MKTVRSKDEDPPIHRIDMRFVSEEEAKKAIKDHHGLVMQFAQTFFPRGAVYYWIDMEDLVNIGHAAVIEAVASFDETRGAKLSSWVGLIVKRRMLEMVRRARGQTRQQQVTAINLLRAKSDPTRMPAQKEIEDLAEAQRVRSCSLFEEDANERSLMDTLCDEAGIPLDEEHFRKQVMNIAVQVMRRKLVEGEREAVLGHIHNESTFSVMNDLDISRQRTSQLAASGKRELRKWVLFYLNRGCMDSIGTKKLQGYNRRKTD